MQPRRLILAALLGGPVIGVLLGIAADPDMVPPPEPAWRKSQPDPIYTESQRMVDAGPQDFSPWSLDRLPTWKRRAMERQVAVYEPLPPIDEPMPAAEPSPEPALLEEVPVPTAPAAGAQANLAAEAASAAAAVAPDSAIVVPVEDESAGA
jgi:hypothetical protein